MKLFVKRVISVAIAACLAVGGNAALIGQPAALFSSTAHAEEVNEENKVKFKYTIANGEVTITGVENAWYRDVVIPEEIDGYPVTTIGKSAFYNYFPASVIVPESVRKIEENAFTRCGDGTYIEIRNKDCEIYPSSETFSAGFAAVYLFIVIAAPKGSTTEEHCKKYGGAFVPLSDEVIEIASGYCGDGVHYSITNDGTMTLTGNGKVYNRGHSYDVIPYCDAYAFFVDKIVIDGNIEIGAYAFDRFFRLKEISIPEGTETIGENAFYECKSLVSIDIPESVKRIDNSAFLYSGIYNDKNNWENGLLYYGDALLAGDADLVPQEVVIKDGTRIIADDVFDDCTQITRVEIPDSVKCIEYSPFYRCESLKSVKAAAEILRKGIMRNSIEEIEITGGEISSRAFSGLTNLRTVKINDGITEIGYCAFYNCTALTSVSLPDSLTMIAASAFEGCSSLTSISLPDGITEIGYCAFYNCTALASVSLPDGLTMIAASAFECCSSLTSISLPDSITEIYSGAFNRTALTSIRFPAGMEYVEYISNCASLETIELPENLSEIVRGDFVTNCPNLKEIKISRSNKNFSTVDGVLFNKEKTVLLNCPNGKVGSYIIPDSVTTIGESAFKDCTNLTSITIPESVTAICDSAFENCTGLSSIPVSGNIEKIGSNVFYNSGFYNNEGNWENGVFYYGSFLIKAKDSISGECKVKDGTKVILSDSFAGCSALTSLVVPESVTAIERYAFYDCENLLNVKIPEGLTEIGKSAFSGCKSLAAVSIPKSVTKIGFEAFYNTALSNNESNWDGDVLYIGDCLVDANLDVSGEIEIKQGTRLIAEMAFGRYFGDGDMYGMLKTVTVPTGVKIICDGAFGGCYGMEKIVIPSSVTQMGKDVFSKYAGNLVIYGYSDSCAQKYAKENGIAFELLSKPDTDPPTEEPTTEKPTDPVEPPTDAPTDPVIEVIADTKTVTIDGVSVLAAVGDVKVADVLSAARGAKLLDKSGNAVNGDMPLATGMKIVFDNKTVEIAVLGDVDGNGEINVADARLALRQAVSLENLNGVYLFAGKVDGDSVGVSEARKILRAAVGLDDSKDWLK